MSYTIPDKGEGDNDIQSILFQEDLETIGDAFAGVCVESGCTVTAQGSPDMTVAVAAGVVWSGGTRSSVTSGNVTVGAANATNPRIDLIVATSAGAKACRAGTAAAAPKPPVRTAGDVVLAQIYIPANDTTIATSQIKDRRILWGTLPSATAAQMDGTTGSAGSAIYPAKSDHYHKLSVSFPIWLPASALVRTGSAAAAAMVGSSGTYPAVDFPDGVTSALYGMIPMAPFSSNAFTPSTISIAWQCTTNVTSGNVYVRLREQVTRGTASADDSADATWTDAGPSTYAVPATAHDLWESIAQSAGVPGNFQTAGASLKFGIERQGGNASDTISGKLYVVGVKIQIGGYIFQG